VGKRAAFQSSLNRHPINTLKDRLENRTQAILDSLEKLSQLSSHGKIDEKSVSKIEAVLNEKVQKTLQALRSGRDSIQFTLKDSA
jgi:hypothetical protein